MRPHQWVKNVFVAAPLFFTPSVLSAGTVVRVMLGFFAFCLVSSAVYILNDYKDREADRQHPSKCNRPLAAGTVAPGLAMGLMAALGVGGLTLAFALSPTVAGIIATYLLLNIAYSMGLKHVAIVDVMVIALGFVFRLEAGSALIDVKNSVWIIMCAGMLALFLAIAKRRDDIVKALDTEHRKSLDGYNRRFLDISLAVVLSAVLLAYMMYTTDDLVMRRLGTDRLYLTVPFVVAGVLRYLQITFVEERSGSPTHLVLTDRFLILTILGWIGVFGVLMYT